MKRFKQIKHLLIFAGIWMSFPGLAQTGQKYLYLQNTINHKVKRLNLENTSYFSISIDSMNGDYESGHTYSAYDPSGSVFGNDEVIFTFWQHSFFENYTDANNTYHYTQDYSDLLIDSTIRLTYVKENTNLDFYITYQTKARRFMYGFGVGLFCASLFNAVFVSPMLGMENGSFQNYNWNRLWKSELYSGLGLAVSIPVSLLFYEKTYYFQTTSSYYKLWRVVDGE
jgi:hypothetical protein